MEEKKRMQLLAFLDATTVEDVVNHKNASPESLLVLESTMTVEQTLRQLAKKEVLSAPLIIGPDLETLRLDGVTVPEGVTKTHPWYIQNHMVDVGIVDMGTLLMALAETIKKWQQEHGGVLPELHDDIGPRFLSKTLDDMPTWCRDGRFVYESEMKNTSLRKLMELFLKSLSNGVTNHRAVILNSNGMAVGVLSQSDLVQFLYANRSKFEGVTDETVEKSGMAQSPVSVVCADAPAIEAFREMEELKLSGLAVVDKLGGRLVANISENDFRGLSPEALFDCLSMPVTEYLSKENGEESLVPITCKSNHKVEDVMRRMIDSHVHRVYLVDSKYDPIGVVTATDVLRYFLVESN
mmetsp:Transcript_5355/g.33557  ORF Transcript_5355/g.33557 Transcript_5355/m.33557 type:complete len:352 (-) Transcript_5355:3068-4123(-)